MSVKTKAQPKQLVFAASVITRIVKAVKASDSALGALKLATAAAAKRYGKSRAVRLALNAAVLQRVPKAKRRSTSTLLSMAWTAVLGTKRSKHNGGRPKQPVAQRLAERYTLRQLRRAVELKESGEY